MKKIVLIFCLTSIILMSEGNAQMATGDTPLWLKSGTLLQKELIEVGKVKNLYLSVVMFKDVNTEARDTVLQILNREINDGKIYEYYHLLKYDEINQLVNAMQTVQDKILKTQVKNKTEYYFKSKTGLLFQCIWEENDRKWTLYMELDNEEHKSYVTLDKDDLKTLIIKINEAKRKIRS